MRAKAHSRLIALGSAVLLALAACGSAEQSPGAGGQSSTAAAPAKRTVQTPKGPVEVPGDPKKIVAIDFQIPYILLDLKANLAGAIDLTAAKDGEPFTQLTIIGTDTGELNFDKIAELDPDLILAADYQEPEYEKLKDRYPTVLIPAAGDQPGWKPQVKAVAEAIGKASAVDELEKKYQGRVTEIKDKHKDKIAAGKWATLGTYDGSGWYLYDKVGGPSTALADLGIAFDEATTKVADGNVAQYSIEQLNQLNGATVLLFDDLGPPVTAPGAGDKLKANPLFTSITAVKAGKVYDGEFNILDYGDALRVLDQIESVLGKI
ncbi:ABC transporter substrate-binding protein [Actinokineospora cianjurensis]|uniref:ABC-type Fe3+-hydroxamate transport system substrate-binding protein n=1 Tax=Actinokineospora cianjurensis TaxID=585224 RepID=A0A421AYL5_9PSEU|nr:ABC transporter substrate-binding protein [Actinokineospora cianjurensis]RLK54874.1 ABC-type Fe3+-hydroxamate transport system substrate-binding protein [Actinokineospora cianjurensis]